MHASLKGTQVWGHGGWQGQRGVRGAWQGVMGVGGVSIVPLYVMRDKMFDTWAQGHHTWLHIATGLPLYICDTAYRGCLLYAQHALYKGLTAKSISLSGVWYLQLCSVWRGCLDITLHLVSWVWHDAAHAVLLQATCANV